MMHLQGTDPGALGFHADPTAGKQLEPSESGAFVEAWKTLSGDSEVKSALEADISFPPQPSSEDRARIILTKAGEVLAAVARERWEAQGQLPKSFFDFLASYDRSDNRLYYNYFITTASRSCVHCITTPGFPPELAWIAFINWGQGVGNHLSALSERLEKFCAGKQRGLRSKGFEFASSLQDYLSMSNSVYHEFLEYRLTHEPSRGVGQCRATCSNIIGCLLADIEHGRVVSRKELSSAGEDVSGKGAEIVAIANRMQQVLENNLLRPEIPGDLSPIARFVRGGGDFPQRKGP